MRIFLDIARGLRRLVQQRSMPTARFQPTTSSALGIGAVTLCVFVLGCNPDSPSAPVTGLGSGASAASSPTGVKNVATGKTVSASLVGYNHTDKTIAAFYVNGEWGGNVFPGTGGGKFVCCVEIPDPWREGYAVTITWEDHEGKMQKRVVQVPKYDPKTLSDFNVHFLRSGQIKVFAVRMGLRHRDYPLTGPEAELKPGVPIEKVF
jgi:hypothetical protein